MADPRRPGELYDAIWDLDLPKIAGVDSGTVRLVLMAMAKHIYGSKLQTHDYRTWPSSDRIAELVDRGRRQVQRILDVLVTEGLVELVRPGLRPGRNRKGRPPIYRLAVDNWPRRTVGNGRVTGDAESNGGVTGDVANAAFPMAASPVTDGRVTGDAESNGRVTGVTRSR